MERRAEAVWQELQHQAQLLKEEWDNERAEELERRAARREVAETNAVLRVARRERAALRRLQEEQAAMLQRRRSVCAAQHCVMRERVRLRLRGAGFEGLAVVHAGPSAGGAAICSPRYDPPVSAIITTPVRPHGAQPRAARGTGASVSFH